MEENLKKPKYSVKLRRNNKMFNKMISDASYCHDKGIFQSLLCTRLLN